MKLDSVLISGASRGIGLAIADSLYQEGYKISLGLRDLVNSQEQFSSWDKDRVQISHYDAYSPATAEKWVVETVEKFGHIEAVINCAGIFRDCSTASFELQALDELLEVNTKAPIILTECAWPYLKQSGRGRVINIVSLAGKFAQGENFGYSVSKHGLLAYTHAIRQAGWDDGIRATAICPGWVNTDMAKGSGLGTEAMIQPQDIALLVKTLLLLPNNASISEIAVNCQLHDLY